MEHKNPISSFPPSKSWIFLSPTFLGGDILGSAPWLCWCSEGEVHDINPPNRHNDNLPFLSLTSEFTLPKVYKCKTLEVRNFPKTYL